MLLLHYLLSFAPRTNGASADLDYDDVECRHRISTRAEVKAECDLFSCHKNVIVVTLVDVVIADLVTVVFIDSSSIFDYFRFL